MGEGLSRSPLRPSDRRWMDKIHFAPRNETAVETIRLVGIYVGESNHSRVS